MTFKLSFNSEDNTKVADGTYEVIVKSAHETEKNGYQYIDMRLTIRNDVPQKFKNMNIFHRLWQNKETGKYSSKQIEFIGGRLGMNGDKEYNTLQDVLDEFTGKVAKVTVKEEEYNGHTNVNIKSWANTSFPEIQHKWKEPQQTQAPAVPMIADEDLPF